MKFAELFLMLAILVFSTSGQDDLTRSPKDGLAWLKEGIQKFSLRLFGRMALDMKTSQNFVLSPFSVWSVMAIMSEGAGFNSMTRQQLRANLKLTKNTNIPKLVYNELLDALNVKSNNIELESSNAIFCDQKKRLKPSFSETLKTYYSTDVQSVDFTSPRSRQLINEYVNKATRGKVRELVGPDDLNQASLILTNAIFFKGQWKIPFNRSLTTTEDFLDERGNVIGKVEMMYQRGPFVFASVKQFQALVGKLSYGTDNRMSMLVFIPHFNANLEQIIMNFEKVKFVEILKNLKESSIKYEDEEVDIYLPRFSIKTDLVLNSVLRNLGIVDVFDEGHSDLSEMDPSKTLFLSSVIHKAQIDVTEEGTVASAVTEAEFADRIIPPKILANKPFAYFIMDEPTDTILFAGIYTKPQ